VRAFVRSHRLELRYLGFAALLFGALVLLNRLDAFSGVDALIQEVASNDDAGVLAIFAIAVIGNMALLVQVPYTLPLLAIATAGASATHMAWLGLAAGVGAAIGGMISFLIAQKILARDPSIERGKLYRWVVRTTAERPRLASLIIFGVVFTPLPDDAVIIPLAMTRYGARRFAPPLFAGKIVHNVVIALLFFQFTAWSSASTPTHVRADLVLGLVLAFVLVILYQAERARAVAAAAADAPVPVPAGTDAG
jgi:membrane protein YqaA with SNARE-associated domain